MAKIYLELRSGVGNQLFQFAFGYALANDFNKELVLCPAYFDPGWKYWLKKIMAREARSFRLPLLLDKTSIPLKISIEERFKKNAAIPILDELKSDISFIKTACAQSDNVYLKGYWQNPLLFLSYTEELIKIVKPTFALSEKYKKMVQKIDDHVVGIHVRRGDFLTNRAFGACTLAYYLTAIETIKRRVDNPTFLVFTNNRKWVEENFPRDIEYQIYANSLNHNTDMEEMFLMTQLRSMIISNSTFSWWSAYLNKTDNHNIICPENWFLYKKLQENSANLVLKDWIMLKNELELND